MEKVHRTKRYIYDPLYGVIDDLPPYIWGVISCPELQRLREVRLCNINSLCLTGGANINRYEHAIGTCHLAQECLNSWPPLNPISEKEQKFFLLAALLHDVASAAFGHSVEYIESKEGFEHEKAFEYVVVGERRPSYQYKSATLEPIFLGMYRELLSNLTEEDLRMIGKIISGKGRFGPLINSTIDLDNIDNVFRLGYHIGLVKSGEVPLKLAKSLYIENDKLVVRKEAVPLVEEWHKVRKMLYSLLLLNPEDFSAKCMLTEAIEIAKKKEIQPFNWYDVDFELLGKLNKIKFKSYSRFKYPKIALHSIIDINKTERQICIQTDDNKITHIGSSSKCLLIGVFFKNVNLSIYKTLNIPEVINKIRRETHIYLSNLLEDKNLREIKLYGEIKENK
jgi:HD superfamily phosphohydrolase